MNNIGLLESLNDYYFQFGIFTAEGLQTVDVNISNTDNTITSIQLKLADVMFFTENGTMTIPGQRILDKSLYYANNLLDEELSNITDRIIMGKINTESELKTRLNALSLKLENQIQGYVRNIIKKNNRLGAIIHKDQDDNKYIYDLNKLSKYIKCKIIKK